MAVSLSKLDDVKEIANALPVLYYKIDANDIIIDSIIGNLPVQNEELGKSIGESIHINCPLCLKSYLVEGIKKVREEKQLHEGTYLTTVDNSIVQCEVRYIPMDQEEIVIFIKVIKLENRMELLTFNQLKFTGLLDMCPDMICVVDFHECRIIEANDAFLNYFKLDKQKLENKHVLDLVLEDYFDILEAVAGGLLDNQIVKDLVVEAKVEGRHSYIKTSCIGVYDNNHLKYIFCILNDVEANKKLDEMKEIFIENMRLLNEVVEFDKMRTEFFSNVSHEFKTPINVLIGALKLMEMNLSKIVDEDLAKKMTRLHDSMRINCYRLLRLVSNLLDLTRIDSGYIKINYVNCDIIDLARSITSSINEYAIARQIQLEFKSDIDETIIGCDPEKIERILLNLLSNAIKFTSRGDNITVYVEANKNEVVMSVKDTGIGIKEDDQKVIFERFKQVNNHFNRNSEGTGIGLALVKSLVEMHNGRIWFESEFGKGTEFFVALPNTLTQCEANYYKGFNEFNTGDRVVMEFSDIYMA
ncbi:PAS domain-containing sensor histidine kinase [Vallitalea okinawensis]|uniref:PAS domain-containing sensor histidine kinase n=1 Tax=Vallitalea okinawensis TaxID=2078660 RepID=UPI0014788618|nr:PAS domain-containing sensor histidine kinase [Vallitalea okinawensis]